MTTLRHICLLVLSLWAAMLSAQTPGLSRVSMRGINAQASAEELASISVALREHKLLRLDAGTITALEQDGDLIELRLILDGDHDWELRLERHDLRAADIVIQVPGKDASPAWRSERPFTFKGYLQDRPGSVARFSLRDGLILGMVVVDGHEFFLEPLAHITSGKPDDRYVLYRLEDVRHDGGGQCGVTQMDDIVQEEPGTDRGGNDCRLARIAIAADGSMVNFLGSVAAVQTRVLDILNWVDGKYQEPSINIAYQLAALFISPNTASDPWTTSQDVGTLLQSFRNWGNGGGFGTSFAVATLWTRRDIQSNGNSGTVGLAYVSVVCTNNRYNLCEHYTTGITAPMIVQAHELGHNWSAQHTTTPGQWIMAPTAALSNINWDPVTIGSIVGHKNSRTCLSNSCVLTPEAQFLVSHTLTCDGVVAFTDLSSNAPDSWLWDFGDGNSSTLQSPIHTYTAPGTYTVQLTVVNGSGEGTIVKTDHITVDFLPAPQITDALVCEPGGFATLNAAGEGDLLWYETAEDDVPVHVGATFTPFVDSTTTWHVASSTVGPLANLGPVSNTFGSGGFFSTNDNWGLRFDVFDQMTLKSVKVFAAGPGTRTIQLLAPNGQVLQTRSVAMPSGESRVQLNMDIPAGEQYLLKLAGSTLNLYRNNAGASFPYLIDGLVAITETNAFEQGFTGYYYYFYDWEVNATGCTSARSEVTAVVENCASVPGIDGNFGVRILADPFGGGIRIDWMQHDGVRPSLLHILDATGRLVHEARVDHSDGHNVRLAADGVYILRLLGRMGEQVAVERFVLGG